MLERSTHESGVREGAEGAGWQGVGDPVEEAHPGRVGLDLVVVVPEAVAGTSETMRKRRSDGVMASRLAG